MGWLRLLIHNQFRIHPSCWGKAVTISLVSPCNSVAAWLENLRYGRRWRAQVVEPPLFVIGHYRSGTTLLHNLLAVDKRFASPTLLECSNPATFLSNESIIEWVGHILPNRRAMDSVAQHIRVPSEDELAVGLLSGYSPYFEMAFPRHAHIYERYLTFEEARPEQARRWQEALVVFLKKVTLKYQKPLILKSPPHTARIRLLLEAFPEAKFIHIHRHPYRVFQSTLHLHRTLMPWLRLQRWSEADMADLEDRVLRNYQRLYRVYLQQRSLIPAGHLHEVSFDDLERDPVTVVGEIYQSLQLPDFDEVRAPLQRYVSTLSGYRKNTFPAISDDLRQRIVHACRDCFDAWDYPVDPEALDEAVDAKMPIEDRPAIEPEPAPTAAATESDLPA